MSITITLSQLGWQPFFQQQLCLIEWEECQPARVVELHRSRINLIAECGTFSLAITPTMPALTVGDWLLLDNQGQFHRPLERLSIFSRKAAGSKISVQLIAANIDTLMVVVSLNKDFNLSRIERYLAMASEAGAEAVVVLTKADCCDDSAALVAEVQRLDPLLMVEAVNSQDASSVSVLDTWCKTGKTLAFLGSSGVGKSTLVNTLLGRQAQTTGGIREQDSKGRHTTTARTLHLLPSGGILLDTPGMRELQLADCESGVADTFSEILALSRQCKFADCQHQAEPGCAVQAAIAAGTLEERRLKNYHKLLREQKMNSASLAEKREHGRTMSRHYRSVQSESRRRKKF